MSVALVTDVAGVVRSLGDVGIRSIVVGEYPTSPVFRSRHCIESHVVPNMRYEADAAFASLLKIGSTRTDCPALMTGRESDVLLVSRNRERLSRHFAIKMAPADLIETCLDKWKFAELMRRHSVPAPKTFLPETEADLDAVTREIAFPMILKPFSQDLWLQDAIYAIVGKWKKAFVVRDVGELKRYHSELSKVHREFMVQEYIGGGDTDIYEMQAYCDRPGHVAGSFLHRKIRTFPRGFGQSSYIRSLHDDRISRVVLEMLEKIDYLGAADIDLKVDPATGRAIILEINPRFGLACHFAARCGANFPQAMFNDVFGYPPPKLLQTPIERRWLYFHFDLRAARQYREAGEWSYLGWLLSLLRPGITYFRWDWKDPGPLLRSAVNYFTSKIRSLFT
ncbi:MAG: hypothetical protein V1495_00205 [Pseudomonadota bacterium]